MATPGLSLVGFVSDQAQALQHLSYICKPPNPDPAALIAEWNVARGKIGPAIQNAGSPDLRDIPLTHPHISQLILAPYAVPNLTQYFAQGATFKMVEIEPLLAFQLTIDSERSAHHCRGLANPPTEDQLLAMCLPLTPQPEDMLAIPGQNSVLVKSRSLNIRLKQGIFNNDFAGILIGQSLPLQHVVRHNGRCYLHNGFHRALGARLAGATHIPCIFRDVADHAAVGISPPGTFDANLLESTNPPTLGHFTQGKAHEVSLRAFLRILHVSWAEHAVPSE